MHQATYVYEGGKPRRKSSFQELLDDDDASSPPASVAYASEIRSRNRALSKISELASPRSVISNPFDDSDSDYPPHQAAEPPSRNFGPEAAIRRTPRYSLYTRLSLLAVILAVFISLAQNQFMTGGQAGLPVVEGGVVRHSESVPQSRGNTLARREDTNTDVCKRWSQQSAIVNGTLYLYGGRATDDAHQTSDQWNSNFLTIDLTQSWDISSPTFKGLPIPSGPPSISNGYLWNSHSALYLYGGEFSDTPVESPVAFSMWEYDIAGSEWIEHSSPETSGGPNSEEGGDAVQRVAEGAGANVPSLGRGWYFGGHQDFLTTQGWSIHVRREYLRSFLEFTFPGATNDQVDDLSSGERAGSDGVWRNITSGGKQDTASFTERADGVLVYIPGFGKEGILLALAGGTNDTFTQMNVIDVFDIAESKWYKQATTGPTPGIRVNPCAVVAAAADGTSYNVYMFAGQNLVPYKQQTQYQDMWILTVPSFTWIEAPMENQAVPYGRSGHTCNIWDGQMIVVGGYIGNEIGCESPGVYVFNLSSLEWQTKFTALSGVADHNPLSQQLSQKKEETGPDTGLEGSYGYQVPKAVVSVIGGNGVGSATVTHPVQSPTAGPLATGDPVTYTVTAAGPTVTASAPSSAGSRDSGPNVGAIVAGVLAGVAAVVAGYFAFCTWVYRKQLKLYKSHVALVQRAAADPRHAEKEAFVMPPSSNHSSDGRSGEQSSSNQNSGPSHGPSSSVDSSGGLNVPETAYTGAGGYYALRQGEAHGSDAGDSTEDLMADMEPSFIGVLLNPRRNLRIVNTD